MFDGVRVVAIIQFQLGISIEMVLAVDYDLSEMVVGYANFKGKEVNRGRL